MEEEGNHDTTTNYCSNCKKDIPSVNYVMHISHCSRNIKLCEICLEPVPISDKDEHFEEYHSKVKCDCGESFEKMKLESHKEKDCIHRQVVCEYCELELQFSEMKSHKDFCGSRTELCQRCKKYVQHKDLENHLNSDCVNEQQFVDNNASHSSRQHARNRIPPEEIIQNINLADGFGFDTETLQRLLHATEGTFPEEHYDTRDMNDYGTLYGIRNEFTQPRQDIVSRGQRNSNPSHDITGRNRNYHNFDDVVDSDDVVKRYQREEDELTAALLACGPNSFESPSYGSHNQNTFEEDNDVTYESVLDETVLPCEFCGEAIQAEQLILHQTGCQLTSRGAARGSYPNLRSTPRSLPPLHHQPLNNEVESSLSDDYDEILLPCEFCSELISTDNLFTHQSMCDPQRTRPSSVLETEYFYRNDPYIPPWNNAARPRASNRPPRPSRPVVSDGRRPENDEFDSPVPSSTSTSSRNNRTKSNVAGSQHAVPRETRDVRVRSNDSPLTSTTNNNSSIRTTQSHRCTAPATENDDSYEIAIHRRESYGTQEEFLKLVDKIKSENYESMQETEHEKKSMPSKPSSGATRRYSNGTKTEGNDSGVLRPQQGHAHKYRSTGSLADKTTKTPNRNKTPSSTLTGKSQSSKEPFKHTVETRKQLTRLAPSFDVKSQSNSDSKQQSLTRSAERGLDGRRGSSERKNSSKSSASIDKKSKKKFA